MEYQLLIDGQWTRGGGPLLPVTNKYTGDEIAAVPVARREEIDAALDAARRAAPVMAALPGHKRCDILRRATALLLERQEDLARTVAAECGKAVKFARSEIIRAAGTFEIAAEEARRIHGETVATDAIPDGEGYFGFWTRRPVGVIAAITPFNFPVNIVAHKLAPALAAGNALVFKPAEVTPLTATKIVQILQDAGLPPGALNLIQGDGPGVGEPLISDPRVDMISFTGSAEVGRLITAKAGIKKVTLELGNNSAVIVAPDADLDYVAVRCAYGAVYNSGQVCLSVQRVYSDEAVYEPLLERFVKQMQGMVVGDPLDDRVDLGPMIDVKEAERVERWVGEAQAGGAQVAVGGRRDGAVYWPTVLTDVRPGMRVVKDEVFGPLFSVIEYGGFEEALRQADDTQYGLQIGVFTRDVNRVFQAVKALNFGGVIINDAPVFRLAHMPYGGNRQSGLGREGVRFAMEEMTNIQMVAIRLKTTYNPLEKR
jgi:acyl-CoA reductase-like NAD-dependent aldehyde dehydrogenase